MENRKIAIISDIHANLNALTSFINYLDNQNINIVLNLGDFISNGPNPCEVFDILINDQRFVNIKGYDEENLFHSVKINEGIGQGKWLLDTLGKERIKKLKKIPSTKTIQINGKTFLMCHHNGWSDIEQNNAHMTLMKEKEYDYLLYGGTHLQELSHSIRYYGRTNIIDPGTLGASKEKRGFFAIINFDSLEPMINFHSIIIKEKKSTNQGYEKSSEGSAEREEDILRETFLYIQGPKQTKDGVMYIDDEVVDRIIQIGIKQCQYVSIGCWSSEHLYIKEILYYLKCRKIKSSEKDEQEWFMGEITKDVVELLLKKRKNNCGRIKWFEISFYSNLEDASPVYSIYHYGKEGFLKKLSKRDLYSIEEILSKYNILYTLPDE